MYMYARKVGHLCCPLHSPGLRNLASNIFNPEIARHPPHQCIWTALEVVITTVMGSQVLTALLRICEIGVYF